MTPYKLTLTNTNVHPRSPQPSGYEEQVVNKFFTSLYENIDVLVIILLQLLLIGWDHYNTVQINQAVRWRLHNIEQKAGKKVHACSFSYTCARTLVAQKRFNYKSKTQLFLFIQMYTCDNVCVIYFVACVLSSHDPSHYPYPH